MNLLPGAIHLIHWGTGWAPFAPLIWLWQLAWGPYHVELVWEIIEEGYKALSMQPPVLAVVIRQWGDTKGPFYQLKCPPPNIDEMLYGWANEKIGKELYILGWETCGMLPRDFYRDVVKELCTNSPYPGAIEKFCRKSDKFVEVR